MPHGLAKVTCMMHLGLAEFDYSSDGSKRNSCPECAPGEWHAFEEVVAALQSRPYFI